MQTCPIHNVPLHPLFTSYFCPKCENGISQHNEEIPFEQLSQKEQRIAIAKDVIAQIEAKQIIPQTGKFVYYGLIHESGTIRRMKECEVCALGALVASTLEKGKSSKSLREYFNDNTFNTTHPREARTNIHTILAPYFSSDQLDEIEASFEVTASYAITRTWRTEKASVMFDKNYLPPNERLKTIMQNIIDNDGVFVVPETINIQV